MTHHTNEPGARDGERFVVAARETTVGPDVTETHTLSVEGDQHGVEEIREEIEMTRAEMSDTIDALQAKLHPQRLKTEAKERVKEATIGVAEDIVNTAKDRARGTGSSMLETIKDNPIPAALAAVGIGWLLLGRSSGSSGGDRYSRSYEYDSYGRTYPYGYRPYGYVEREDNGGIRHRAGEVAGRAGGEVAGRASEAADRVGEAAGRVRHDAEHVVRQAQDRVEDLGHEAQYQASRAQSQFQRMMRENPLAVGAVAVGLGAAIGLAIPETPQEDELLGEARDRLMDEAQSAASGMKEKIPDMVAEGAKAAAQQVSGATSS